MRVRSPDTIEGAESIAEPSDSSRMTAPFENTTWESPMVNTTGRIEAE